MVASKDGKRLFVAHAGTHELSILDADALIEKLLAIPRESAVDVPNDLTFLDGLRRRVPLASGSPAVNGPRGLAVVGSKAFVAAYFTDNLAVVDLKSKPKDPDSNNLTGTIALGPVPRMTVQRRGEMLFNDATRCVEHWQSCASCHPDARIDGLNWDLVNDGLGNPKNGRSMVLAHKTPQWMSVGIFPSAEAAVRGVMKDFSFAEDFEKEAATIDAYLKSLKPVPSPHLVGGKLSPAAERGKKLFFDAKINCAKCHPEPLYTDLRMHDVGSRGEYDYRLRAFDTPTLIECWRTAPYMHDGHFTTIKELLTKGKHGNFDELTGRQIDDLVEFVLSL